MNPTQSLYRYSTLIDSINRMNSLANRMDLMYRNPFETTLRNAQFIKNIPGTALTSFKGTDIQNLMPKNILISAQQLESFIKPDYSQNFSTIHNLKFSTAVSKIGVASSKAATIQKIRCNAICLKSTQQLASFIKPSYLEKIADIQNILTPKIEFSNFPVEKLAMDIEEASNLDIDFHPGIQFKKVQLQKEKEDTVRECVSHIAEDNETMELLTPEGHGFVYHYLYCQDILTTENLISLFNFIQAIICILQLNDISIPKTLLSQFLIIYAILNGQSIFGKFMSSNPNR